LTAVLGLSGYFHDAAAALVVDGQLAAFSTEERHSRRAGDSALPLRAAASCLQQAGLTAKDLDLVVWHEKPLLKLERVLLTSLRTVPRSLTTFRRAMVSMMGDKLWVGSHIVRGLVVDPKRVQYAGHHQSHAASAWFCCPFPSAAVLVVDGVGEWATTSSWAADSAGLRPLRELHFPHSLGLLLSVFTAFLGFPVNAGEELLEGLAATGQPSRRADLERVVRVSADGAFELDMDYFCFHRDPQRSWTAAFEQLLGPPRGAGEELTAAYRDLAASVQSLVEDVLLGLARQAHSETGAPTLCLAGTVLLNRRAVARLLAEGPFDDVFVQPAAGDAGAALGAALLGAEAPRTPLLHANWGPEIDVGGARAFLRDAGATVEELTEPATTVAGLLGDGKVVGWMQGRSELGPRSLGQRTVLAAVGDPETRARLDQKLRRRQPFHPYGASVLAETSSELCALPSGGQWLRRFQTTAVPVRSGRLAAAAHSDGSVRLHEVYDSEQPLMAELLRAVGQGTGEAAVLTTSFHMAGEPTVESPADGWTAFLRTGIDALVVGPLLVRR
jgi:carbamoyltransferase